MRRLAGNSESLKVKVNLEKSHLMGWLFCAWSLSGFLRSLIPTLSEYIYVIHVPIILLMIIRIGGRKGLGNQIRVPFWILAGWLLVVLSWQTLDGIISGKQFAFVFFFYIFVTFSIPFVAAFVSQYGVNSIFQVLPYLVFVNLFFSLNQVFFKNNSFFLNLLNEAPRLGTSRTFFRATGTFTSPGAFALFVSLSLAIVLWARREVQVSKHLSSSMLFALFLMVAISGSRSLIVYISFAIVSSIIFSGFHSIKLIYPILAVTSISILSFLNSSILSRLSPAVYAFFERIQTASTQEDSSERIWSAFFGFIYRIESQMSFFGEGLGSRTNAILGYESPNWIEEELTRITVEGGTFTGLLFFAFRWSLFVLFLVIVVNVREKNTRFFVSFLFGSYAITLLVGQIFGQGSVAVYFILVTGILFGLTSNSKAKWLPQR